MKDTINITQVKESRIASVDFDNIPFGKILSDHMFIADYKDGEWQDPRIVPVANLSLNPANMALHYGQSIFEGMKASINSDGVPLLFRPEMHAKRMNASANRMCMPTIPEDLFIKAVTEIVRLEKKWIPTKVGSALYLRPFMFAMDEFIGVAPSATFRFIILALPVGPYYNKPVKLLADERFVRAAKGGVGEAKTAGNYAASMLPMKMARENGFDQILWLDARYRKFLQEVGTMNIFFVINGKVVTPLTDGAILKGITRDSIITLLSDMGYEVDIRPITIDELIDAYEAGQLQEVFGTGTAAVISNVSTIKYKEKVIELDESNFVLSHMIKEKINLLRNGTIEDPYGWVVPIEETVSVS